MKFRKPSHYEYLEKFLPTFFKSLGISWENNCGIIRAHGDKAYSYRDFWEKKGISFNYGVAIYLLSYCRPYSSEVRETKDGWVAPKDWVADNYNRFKPYLPSDNYRIKD